MMAARALDQIRQVSSRAATAEVGAIIVDPAVASQKGQAPMTPADLTALSDDELAARFSSAINEVDDPLAGDLWALLDEALERWAPGVAVRREADTLGCDEGTRREMGERHERRLERELGAVRAALRGESSEPASRVDLLLDEADAAHRRIAEMRLRLHSRLFGTITPDDLERWPVIDEDGDDGPRRC